MVPHKINSKVWPGLVTKEKTMKYPISAMCTVCVLVLGLGLGLGLGLMFESIGEGI